MVDASALLAGQSNGPQGMLQRFLDYKGTTSAALNTMINEGIEQVIHKGLDAAEKEAIKMSKDNE
jgi:pyrroline-5-carboxylate reductase